MDMEMPKPQPEHAWMKQLVGEWTFHGEADMGDGTEPCISRGRESAHMLGDFWLVCESHGELPNGGGPCDMRMTLGYDPAPKAYVGHWCGSMMSHQYIYKGQLDAAKKVLTLDTEGPNFTGDGMARFQDVITLVNADERTLHSQMLQPDGSWKRFMLATYKRVK